MQKYFKSFYIAVVVFASTALFNQAISSASYNPEAAKPTSLAQVSELAQMIGTYNNSKPIFSPEVSGGKANNKAEALAKMGAMHCIGRDDSLFEEKSCFNTDDSSKLENVYNLVVGHPTEYIVASGNQYLIREIDSSDVSIDGVLGYESSKKATPLKRVMLTITGIKTAKSTWDISKAQIASIYLITEDEYQNLLLKKEEYITK